MADIPADPSHDRLARALKPYYSAGAVSDALCRLYREQGIASSLRTMALLREQGPQQLHSRKLRSLDEPAFR